VTLSGWLKTSFGLLLKPGLTCVTKPNRVALLNYNSTYFVLQFQTFFHSFSHMAQKQRCAFTFNDTCAIPAFLINPSLAARSGNDPKALALGGSGRSVASCLKSSVLNREPAGNARSHVLKRL
jgi:hypothetical protein